MTTPAQPNQRRTWSWFVLVVGLVLVGLCALDPSSVALAIGLVMALVGLLSLLFSS